MNRTVTSLDLGGNRLSDRALVALMSADPLVYFEELELTRNDKRVTRAGSLLSVAGASKPPPPPP